MNVMRKILIFIVSVVLFLLIMATILINSGKNLVTKENLSNLIKDADILNIDINFLFNLDESGITLKDKITDIALDIGIPSAIIDDILASDEINYILGDFFNKTISYAINGNDKPYISNDSIKTMQRVARESLDSHINIMIDEEILDQYVINYASRLVDLIPDRNEIIANIPIEEIQAYTSFNIMYLYILIIFIIILLSLFSWSFYKPIKYIGITFILSGLIFVILGSMNNIIIKALDSQFENFKLLIEPLIINILTIWFKLGVLFSFSGVLLFISYIVINRIIINNKEI